MVSLPSRNKTLAIATKNHAKLGIKVFNSCKILMDFFTLFQIVCSRL